MSNLNSFAQIDLQLALIFIGVIIIVAIIIYNIARASKSNATKLNATKFNVTEQTQTQGTNSIEQSLSPTSTATDEMTLASIDAVRKEPSLGEVESIPPVSEIGNFISNANEREITQPSLDSEQVSYISRIDPNIDCVVDFKFNLPVSGSEILALVQKWPKKDDLRIALEGLIQGASQEDPSHSNWDLIQADQAYEELQVSIQLANRRGPLQAEQLAEFIGLVRELSQELDAEIDVPPIHDILNDATDLDQFAIQCDIQLGFNLSSNLLSWQCAEVQNALLNKGFILSREGSSYNYLVDDILLFKAQVASLNFLRDDLQTTRIKQIYFSLDVPLVPKQLNPFIKMLELAQTLANDLDGRLLDDNGQQLSILSTQSIQAQIEPIYQLMLERKIEPGSATALRLFN